MEYEWIGSNEPYLDQILVKTLNDNLHIGCFGGSTTHGATKNEDALFVLQDEHRSWTFTALLDSHKSSHSAELITSLIRDNKEKLVSLCISDDVFSKLDSYFISLFSDEMFKERCRGIEGETLCILCFQRGPFLWWFSIGDCMAFLFHSELAYFKQYGLNQRQFYEWIGQSNTFDLPVPCYTIGRRQLRQGRNRIVLTTDGIFDTEDRYFQDYSNLYNILMNDNPLEQNIEQILTYLSDVRDSTSLICWEYNNDEQGLNPSD
ncbi:protein phosphatase 2C domain-containing protein [Paenibacillus sp. 1P07SE]|uniref:protein phosphatase 2C domain-containing protein n=1 Tax=Paenibacillus sp. 1P07SE TaxID=3132209 RepID=UPI0039A585BD